MKTKFLLLSVFLQYLSFAQEHYAGLLNSSRIGVLSVGMNPAELMNLNNRLEVNIFGTSINASNNKVGYTDIVSGTDLKKLLFESGDPANLRFDAEISGPGAAFKVLKWGFAVTTKANAKLDVVDVNVNLGDALFNSATTGLASSSSAFIEYKDNQRVVGTSWGEVGLSIARTIASTEKHKLSLGATFKLLFPGSYSNAGLDAFSGTVTKVGTDLYLSNATAGLNVAYSGNLAGNFTDFSDYSKSFTGNLNGFMGDVGINYQWRDKNIVGLLKSKNKYKINIGAAVKNIGSMTFKNADNYNTNYKLNTSQNLTDTPTGNDTTNGLLLSDIKDIKTLTGIENLLISKGFINKSSPEKKDFKVKLPTTFVAYADIKLISKLYISGYMQRRVGNDSDNDQITAQNLITVTPRINLGYFEAYVPITSSEISGFNTGFGLRIGGFYLGSGSAITTLINNKNSKQADIYTGFRWGFL